MNAPQTMPVIGRDPYPLPAINFPISPAFTALTKQYHAAYDDKGDAGGDLWGAAARAIASCSPACSGDAAVKLMIGLHYLHPTRIDGALAIDTEHFSCDGAGEMLIACMNEQVRACLPACGSAEDFDAAYRQFAALKAIENGLPEIAIGDEERIENATDATDEAFDAMMALPAPDGQRLALKLTAALDQYDLGGCGLDRATADKLFADIVIALNAGEAA